jgi:predicted transcriptional regulator
MDKTEQRGRIVSAQLRPEMVERLRQLAEAGDRTLSAEIRRAVSRHVERERGRFVTVEEEKR